MPEIKVGEGSWRRLPVFYSPENGTLVSAENETETKMQIPVSVENKNGLQLPNLRVRRPETNTKFGRSLVLMYVTAGLLN